MWNQSRCRARVDVVDVSGLPKTGLETYCWPTTACWEDKRRAVRGDTVEQLTCMNWGLMEIHGDCDGDDDDDRDDDDGDDDDGDDSDDDRDDDDGDDDDRDDDD